jgi:hypothetical protein
MLNNSMKLLLINQRNRNNFKLNTETSRDKLEIQDKFKIQEKEIEKLRNPSKGQIFIHFIDTNNFNLYRFNGKEWLEIKE